MTDRSVTLEPKTKHKNPKAANPRRAAVHIGPSAGKVSLRLNIIWAYRELLFFFIWRDIKVRYKQTVMGASWAILQPFLTMLIFSLFFGRFAKVPSDNLPYPIFSFAALVPWTFFSNGVLQSSNILVSNANMLKKIYFPRLTMPIASILTGLLDFILAFLVLIAMMLFYRITPTINTLWLPCFVLLALITALGAGFWLSALNAQFRDVRYIVPFLIQAWLFSTPIAYPSSIIPERWRALYGINPMTGVVEGFRWALLGTDTAPGLTILVSCLFALALLISGVYYFRRKENTFADIL